MNNEPVAWMQTHYKDGTPTKFSTVKTWEDDIPLYTHPHPDNLGFALSIIDQQKLEIKRLKAKTLTDEEILEEWMDEPLNSDGEKEVLDFARAILRKANEK